MSVRIATCWRPIPARVGEEHAVTRLLKRHFTSVVQTNDTRLPLHEFDAILMLENGRWFPQILKQLADLRRTPGRPLLAVWHWEPLPLPSAAATPSPALSLREIAKIVLRDVRATDVYSNLAVLRRLRRDGWPDILSVSSRAWQEALAEHRIGSQWVPYGYEESDGQPIDGRRDIDALFLGALDVPRRRAIVDRLRRRGVNLVSCGSWFDKTMWGPERTRLINRAQAFLNIQRYPREVSAHRLILGMANKSLVISERIYRPEPYIAGEHYVEADAQEIPDVLEYYRRHPDERRAIVERAYRFVTETVTMESAVAQIAGLIEDRLSARFDRAGQSGT